MNFTSKINIYCFRTYTCIGRWESVTSLLAACSSLPLRQLIANVTGTHAKPLNLIALDFSIFYIKISNYYFPHFFLIPVRKFIMWSRSLQTITCECCLLWRAMERRNMLAISGEGHVRICHVSMTEIWRSSRVVGLLQRVAGEDHSTMK